MSKEAIDKVFAEKTFRKITNGQSLANFHSTGSIGMPGMLLAYKSQQL